MMLQILCWRASLQHQFEGLGLSAQGLHHVLTVIHIVRSGSVTRREQAPGKDRYDYHRRLKA